MTNLCDAFVKWRHQLIHVIYLSFPGVADGRCTVCRRYPVKTMADSFYKLEDEAFPSFLCKSLDSTSGRATLGNVTLGSGPGLPVAASTVAKIKPASETRWGSSCCCCCCRQMWREKQLICCCWVIYNIQIQLECALVMSKRWHWMQEWILTNTHIKFQYVNGHFDLMNIVCCSYRLVRLGFCFAGGVLLKRRI